MKVARRTAARQQRESFLALTSSEYLFGCLVTGPTKRSVHGTDLLRLFVLVSFHKAVVRLEHRVGVPGSSCCDEGSDGLISRPANIAVELLVLACELVVCGNIAVELLVLAFELVVCGKNKNK